MSPLQVKWPDYWRTSVLQEYLKLTRVPGEKLRVTFYSLHEVVGTVPTSKMGILVLS